MLLLTVTVVFALPTSSFNCFTLTASVSSVPATTFVILLPPLFKPVFVKDTLGPVPFDGLIVIPLGPITVVVVPSVVVTLPASTFVVVVPSAFVNSALVKPFNSFANFTSTVEPFAFTPILLSDNLSLSAPPVILKAIPPSLFKPCVSVLDALSAPNWIVLFATAFAASDTVFN